MARADATFLEHSWRKSSYSGTQTECVEVACCASVTGVRDTKHRDGGALRVSATAWRALTARV